MLGRWSRLALRGRNLSCRDMSYFSLENICNPSQEKLIKNILALRQSEFDYSKLIDDYKNYTTMSPNNTGKDLLYSNMMQYLLKLPNRIHPEVMELSKPLILEYCNKKKLPTTKTQAFEKLGEIHGYRRKQLGNITGSRTYCLSGTLAELERALINYTIDYLNSNNFELISVPDVIPKSVVQSCGFDTNSERSQVYFLHPKSTEALCLSGTAEIAISNFCQGRVFRAEDLPKRFVAVSRCHRAEIAKISKEKGFYRVHQFYKVEMFGVTKNDDRESSKLLNEILDHQKQILTHLNLHFQVLNMPPYELGDSAFQKFDIEAWMPGRGYYGEVCSASNCTDYQSTRLNISYQEGLGKRNFVHTVNGTACAIPRVMIALVESNQMDRNIIIPDVLIPYMRDQHVLKPNKNHNVIRFR